MTRRCVVATANPNKAAEIIEILATRGDVELIERPNDVGDIDETGDTLFENARLKATALCEATGELAIADDTGLVVDALGGAPGVYSARYAGVSATSEQNMAKLLDELSGLEDRRAHFATVAYGATADGLEVFATGEVAGVIIEAPRGTGGFGYDPIFVPDEGDGRTFAEMDAAEKHAISHRGRAFRALADRLADVGILDG
ncbi:MAG: RdgB/HAM1 family non-canonical purine NTP pyrophosphatase [Actinomycetes bacterium]